MERQPPSILIRINPGTSGHDCRSRILSGGEVDIDLVTERSPQFPPTQPGTVKFGGKRSPSIDLSQQERRPNRTDCSIPTSPGGLSCRQNTTTLYRGWSPFLR